MLGITRLIERVVACDVGVVFIMSSYLLPQPNSTVLEVLVVPEGLGHFDETPSGVAVKKQKQVEGI